ncbi:MAG: hypothetical protein ABI600_18150 [Luteolibacter sp.]
MDTTTPPSPTPASASTPHINPNQSAAAPPAWEILLRRDVIENALTAARGLEKLGIPEGQQAEIATAYAEETISKAVEKIVARLLKSEKSVLDFIQKTTQSIRISTSNLLAFAAKTHGITDSKVSAEGPAPVAEPVETVAESPKSDNPTQPLDQEAAAGL